MGENRAREIITVDITRHGNERKTPTAAYVRLSVENGGHGDEGTLQTQIALVHDYIRKQPDLELYDTYVDNGISGVGTFADRPGFGRMLEAVWSGRVKCIVVKDLSRFGRNYLECATYIEHIFSRLGVRLIAVTDNFDSTRPEDVNGLAFPVKNLINEMYAKDIGKKIKNYYEMRDKEGKLLSVRAPFGYLMAKDGDDRKLVPDPETARYVRMIFHWYLSGVRFAEIAERLNLTGVPCPKEYNAMTSKNQRDNDKNNQQSAGTQTADVQTAGEEKRKCKIPGGWSDSAARHIVQNPLYTGDTVNLRYSSGVQKRLPRDEWHVIPNTHEAIITHEVFDKAWEMLEISTRQAKKRSEKVRKNREESPAIFSGKLVCGTCGNNFQVIHQRYKDGKRANFYHCSNKDCVNAHDRLHEDVFKILIMDQIRILIRAACDYRGLAKDLISDDPGRGRAGSIRVKLTNEKANLSRIEERALNAYEDYAEGVIERADYLRLKEKHKAEKKKVESVIRDLEQKDYELKEKAGKYLKITEDFEGYLDAEGYAPDIVDRLVEKAAYFPDGSLSLTLKCEDVYEEALSFLDGQKAETPDLSQAARRTVDPAD